MARKPRKEASSQIYHIIMRGNNKQSIFFDDNDRNFFINRLFKYASQLEIHVYAYCLMQNHVHILLGHTPKKILSLFVQKLATSYVYHFNHRYDCSGHLFQGRFKSEPVEDEIYLKNVLRYILRNPENAGICSMKTYTWSSYRELTQTTTATNTKKDFIYSLFGSQHELKNFLEIPDNQNYMEYENKPTLNDDNARIFILKLLKIPNLNILRSVSVEKQLNYLQLLKKHHFSISQISRITGFPRKIIHEA